jgi:hypothetical protein
MKLNRLLQLLESCPSADLRKPFLETALAIELGYAFALPTTPVDSVVAHFDQFHADAAKKVIGELNNLYPFSVNVTYNMVVDVYRNRYVLCHVPSELTCEDICAQLSRPAFEQTVDAVHAKVLTQGYGNLLRSDLAEFVRRFVV